MRTRAELLRVEVDAALTWSLTSEGMQMGAGPIEVISVEAPAAAVAVAIAGCMHSTAQRCERCELDDWLLDRHSR